MRGKDFLLSMSDVDNEIIAEADEFMAKKRRKSRWYLGVAAAACLCLIAGVLLFNLSKNNSIVYADTMDNTWLYAGVPSEKVDYMSDFSKYSSNTKVRVMLIVYGMEDGYPEIYGQTFDGKTITELTNEYYAYVRENENDPSISERWSEISEKSLKIDAEMSEKEIDMLTSIGAEDIVKLAYNKYIFTISNGKLKELTKGKCSYRVVMATKEYTYTDLSIEDLYGEYECIDIVYVPLYSSIAYASDAMKGQKLFITENSVVFGGEVSIYDIAFEIDSAVDTAEKFYGFESIDIMFMPDDLVRLFSNEHVIYNISNTDTRIFAGDGYVYLDRGLRGVFKFKKKKSY